MPPYSPKSAPLPYPTWVARLTRYWLMPGVLVAIALRQIILAHTVGLSAWHGGGFGMFASIDRDERRVIEVWVQDDSGQRFRVDLADSHAILQDVVPEPALTLTRTVPTPQHLAAIADALIDLPWERDTESDTVKFTATAAAGSLELRSVTVQVLRLEYDHTTQRLWYRPLSPAIEVWR